MGKKEFGVNTKKEEAKERKETKKTEKKVAEEKKKEDSKWEDNDKQVQKKAQKEKEEREKAEAKQRAKDEAKQQLEREMAEAMKKKTQPTVERKTKYEISKYEEELARQVNKKMGIEVPQNAESAKPGDEDSDDYEQTLEKNWNHVWREEYQKELERYDEVVDASGIDAILALTDEKGKAVDKHPEKRMKAAWQCFVDERMEKMRKEHPNCKRSQILQMLSKEWKSYSENPIVKAKALGVWRGDKQKPKKGEDSDD